MIHRQKGSVPFAALVAITSGIAITLLAHLLLAEALSDKKYNSQFQNEVYQLKSILETTNNLVLQKLSEAEKKLDEGTVFPLVNADMDEIENALNTSVLPHLFPDASVSISNLKYNKSLDMLCNMLAEENPYTFQKEVTGIDCANTYFYMAFDLEVNTSRGQRKMNIKFSQLYPTVSLQTGKIKVNLDNLEIDVSGL